MKKEKKKLINIIIWNTIGFILFGIFLIFAFKLLKDYQTSYLIGIYCTAVPYSLIILILSIIILATNWKNEWCDSHRVLLALLSLFLIHFIGIYIFACAGKVHVNEDCKQEDEIDSISRESYKAKENNPFSDGQPWITYPGNGYQSNQPQNFVNNPYSYPQETNNNWNQHNNNNNNNN